MADYIIEGTIKELSSKENECIFKINGVEGYSVKRDKVKYNILYSEDIRIKTDKDAIPAFVLLPDRGYKLVGKQECLLATALMSGKKIHATITAEENEIKTGKAELSVSSITLLAD